MPVKRSIIALPAVLVAAICAPAASAASSPWIDAAAPTRSQASDPRALSVSKNDANFVRLDSSLIASELRRAPLLKNGGASARTSALETITLPTPGGKLQRFRIWESQVMAPALARRHPETTSYSGEGVDDPGARVQISSGPTGFHAQVLTPSGDWYVDPYVSLDKSLYASYERADLSAGSERFKELPPLDAAGAATRAKTAAAFKTARRNSGDELKTYRLALATNGEYSAKFLNTKAGVNAELVSVLTRLNGIFEAELSIRFQLVAGNDSLIYLNPATDPYTDNTDGVQLLSENQANIDSVIGNAGYDLGHVFSTGGGGVAGLGVLGETGSKARGVTGSSNPTADAFWVDYVAHEMGHQLGGNHTFQGTLGNCAGGNANQSTATEPGSGSTIMAYAGICSDDDLQPHSDAYYNAVSYQEIRAEIEGKPSVGVATATGNSAPSVSIPAGASFFIPPMTPFALTAAGSDVDGDSLTYGWEQFDAGVLRTLSAQPKTGGALFRSLPPTTTPTRFFPALSKVVAGTTSSAAGGCAALVNAAERLGCWSEYLTGTAGYMNFRVTARDDATGGGGLSYEDVSVGITGSQPFKINSMNGGSGLQGGSLQNVAWATVGTDAPPYNSPLVDILASTDGGATWPTVLANDTPNDGSADVRLPNVASSQGRIMVRSQGSIFYDVTDGNYSSVVDSQDPTVTLTAPAEGASYKRGQVVNANYSCADPGGSGIASCSGTAASGSPINTATTGSKSFTVTARDGAGRTASVTRHYTVTAGRPDAKLRLFSGKSTVGDGIYNDLARQRITATVRAGRSVRFLVTAQNDAAFADTLQLHGGSSSSRYRVRYLTTAGRDVTKAVTSGTYTTARLAAGSQSSIVAVVTVSGRAAKRSSLSTSVRVGSRYNAVDLDTVAFTVRRR